METASTGGVRPSGEEIMQRMDEAIEDVKSGRMFSYHAPKNNKFNYATEEELRAIADNVRTDDGRIRVATMFSGGGLLNLGLRNLPTNTVFGVEYDGGIAQAYADNHGGVLIKDVNDADYSIFRDIIDYLHASPVCHDFSTAKVGAKEEEQDIAFANSVVKALTGIRPKTFTLEQVPGYKGSESFRIIADTLDKLGYTHDAYSNDNVYQATDFGSPSMRERLFIRATLDGELPAAPKGEYANGGNGYVGWYDTVSDLIPALEDRVPADWMQKRFDEMGIDPYNADDYAIVLYGTKGKSLAMAYAGENNPSPAITANSSDAVILVPPGAIDDVGHVKVVTPQLLGRLMGMPDNYNYPTARTRAIAIVGNGISRHLTEGVVAPMLGEKFDGFTPDDGRRYSYGYGLNGALNNATINNGQPETYLNSNIDGVFSYTQDFNLLDKDASSEFELRRVFDMDNLEMSLFRRMVADLSVGATKRKPKYFVAHTAHYGNEHSYMYLVKATGYLRGNVYAKLDLNRVPHELSLLMEEIHRSYGVRNYKEFSYWLENIRPFYFGIQGSSFAGEHGRIAVADDAVDEQKLGSRSDGNPVESTGASQGSGQESTDAGIDYEDTEPNWPRYYVRKEDVDFENNVYEYDEETDSYYLIPRYVRGLWNTITPEVSREYLDAANSGDVETARRMFNRYVLYLAEDNITPILYAGKGYRRGGHGYIANAIKNGNKEAIDRAATEMAALVPENAVLVPIPSHSGRATDTLQLANAIAEKLGGNVPVVDCLRGKERQSQRIAKQNGQGLTVEDMGMEQDNSVYLPYDREIILIDNVVNTGTTAAAAVRAVGGGVVLAYTYAGTRDHIAGLKSAEPITYDNKGNVIPLEQRFDVERSDIRFSYNPAALTDDDRDVLSAVNNTADMDGVANLEDVANQLGMLPYTASVGSRGNFLPGSGRTCAPRQPTGAIGGGFLVIFFGAAPRRPDARATASSPAACGASSARCPAPLLAPPGIYRVIPQTCRTFSFPRLSQTAVEIFSGRYRCRQRHLRHRAEDMETASTGGVRPSGEEIMQRMDEAIEDVKSGRMFSYHAPKNNKFNYATEELRAIAGRQSVEDEIGSEISDAYLGDGRRYSISTPDGDVYRGLLIDDKSYPFSEDITSGNKQGETRADRDAFLDNAAKSGERIALIRSGIPGKFSAYATTKIGDPIWIPAENFHKDYWQNLHRVPVGDKYDIQPGQTGKWYYPFVDKINLDEEVKPTSHSPRYGRFDDEASTSRKVLQESREDDRVAPRKGGNENDAEILGRGVREFVQGGNIKGTSKYLEPWRINDFSSDILGSYRRRRLTNLQLGHIRGIYETHSLDFTGREGWGLIEIGSYEAAKVLLHDYEEGRSLFLYKWGPRVSSPAIAQQIFDEIDAVVGDISTEFIVDPRLPKTVTDEEYEAARQAGDETVMRRMLDVAAWNNGYTYRGAHRTNAEEYDAFDKKYFGSAKNGSQFGHGFYVSLNGSEAFDKDHYGKRRMDVYVKAESPFNANHGMGTSDIAKLIDRYGEVNQEDYPVEMLSDPDTVFDYLIKLAEANGVYTGDILSYLGYDSVIEGNQLCLFEPSQIKSAELVTEENGEPIPISRRFDDNQDSIRFSYNPAALTDDDRDVLSAVNNTADMDGVASLEDVANQLGMLPYTASVGSRGNFFPSSGRTCSLRQPAPDKKQSPAERNRSFHRGLCYAVQCNQNTEYSLGLEPY